jgi:Fe-Mn family superoxide dismutase
MAYDAKSFEHLLGTEGFSDELLTNHFTLYQGYVANTNKVAETLASLITEGEAATPEFAELKRRFGWEFNGLVLHEYYFGNMAPGGVGIDKDSTLCRKISEDFGSFEAWEADFKATGAMRGIGWVVLCHEPRGGRLFNTWVGEHDVGHLAGASPLLVMDVFEHAFMTDYGLKRADYIAAFFKNIDWKAAEARLK